MDLPDQEGAAEPYAGRTFIILNPAAGVDDADRLKRRLGSAFTARNAAFDLAETRGPGHATELAALAARMGYRAVCIVGGDGTLAEAAHALHETSTPLAIVPRGTGNQVAQNLGIPTDLEDAVDVVVNGRPTPMDLGRIDGRSFALATGAGYDAAVMASATRELKERWGFGAYLYAAAKEAIVAEPAEFRITADGETVEVRAVAVLIANVGELFAGLISFPLSPSRGPRRSWEDGLLDVIIMAPRGLGGFAAILWRAARRRFAGDDRLLHFQAREVTIAADRAMPVEVDGDPAGQTPFTAAAVPGALSVITPAGSGAGRNQERHRGSRVAEPPPGGDISAS